MQSVPLHYFRADDRRYNFGGGDDDGHIKSKKEVMQEVIAKSKFYKAERQKDKLDQVHAAKPKAACI